MIRIQFLVCLFVVIAASNNTSATEPERKAGDLLPVRVKEIELRFRWCPPGSFRMGSPANEVERDPDEAQVNVALTQGFWMLETEVTQELYQAITNSEPWTNPFKGSSRSGVGPKYPAHTVNHHDATAFCVKLTDLLAQPSHAFNGAKLSVRLPTEAEWEYACRAGTTTTYHFGNGDSQLGEYAWHDRNSGRGAHPVGEKKPNAWGLRDMHGNVWEWCADWHGPNLPGGTNPQGPSKGDTRVLRGGAWFEYFPRSTRSANRDRLTPARRDYYFGFRIVGLLSDEKANHK